MRSILWIVTLFVVIGAFVAHFADKTIVNPPGKSINTEAMSRTSSSEATRIASSPLAQYSNSQAPTSNSQVPAKPALPQVIILSPSSSSSSSSGSGRTVTLRDDGSGHFRTEARVDGRRIDFMIDTGATAVVLRASTAAQLGIRPSASDYKVKVMTGNGEIRAALVLLNSVEVGDITVRDVRALVQTDESVGMNLLGMTFLSRIKWTHDRGKLVLEQ
jgi:aspartyl protease family protein